MRWKLFPILLVFCCGISAVARTQTLDQGMSELAASISTMLSEKGYKNLAVIEFMNLQGQSTELGRFLSDQLAIEIVLDGKVSVMDRANISSILAEHRLTEEGLVNPANAKRLGEFAGVDAILSGNITALDDNFMLMVRAISTSSAAVEAGGRITFPVTREIQQLFNRRITGNSSILGSSAGALNNNRNNGSTSYEESIAIASKDIGSLRIVLKSVMPLNRKDINGRDINGIRASFEFINIETQSSIAVALNSRTSSVASWDYGLKPEDILRTALVDDNGVEWNLYASGITGMSVVKVGRRDPHNVANPTDIISLLQRRDQTGTDRVVFNSFGDYYEFVYGTMTPIQGGESVVITMDFIRNTSRLAGLSPKFIQITSEIIIATTATNSRKSYSLQNLTFDRINLPAED